MPSIRLLFLWHMHQPYYKDLVTGEYRLPWVRLHALKDYYGMVKLLSEFPGMHQTFNLVPSMVAQLQDYVSGTARDPFLEITAKRAGDCTPADRLFVLQYLFQANLEHMIGRYPRYRELWEHFGTSPYNAQQLTSQMTDTDLTDLQVLSQIAWMDEYFLEDLDIRDLVRKQRGYSLEDQQLVVRKQREFLARVLPAYAAAAQVGTIEISASPFYHPILPLLCDTDAGSISHHGLPLPDHRFRHPEDAREQIVRALDLHQKTFGVRPRGLWPSEGSVSNDVLAIAHNAGLSWAATDEGVLGRSIGFLFERDHEGRLNQAGAEKLYRIYKWERGGAEMHLVFRDHSLSDLIGFVYAGVDPRTAAADFVKRVKESAQSVLASGRDAVVPIILDGENAWEFYPRSGREFLRCLYQAILEDRQFEMLTIAEAIARDTAPETIGSIAPGSWINANFDVWIGAPEDNLAWDHLSAARDFYDEHASRVTPEQRQLALEELLIAEGSDWNWWYGPEHHSANDRDFDELYRKHLSNMYYALGATPPDILAQPILSSYAKPRFTPQSAYIHPEIDGKTVGYFDWLGAAVYIADRRSSAMHGKQFLLDTGYAGIDEKNLYCRLDFMEPPAEWGTGAAKMVIGIECHNEEKVRHFHLQAEMAQEKIASWQFAENGGAPMNPQDVSVGIRMETVLESRFSLALLGARSGSILRVRFSLWQDQLPVDALPQEGSLEVHVLPESELAALAYTRP